MIPGALCLQVPRIINKTIVQGLLAKGMRGLREKTRGRGPRHVSSRLALAIFRLCERSSEDARIVQLVVNRPRINFDSRCRTLRPAKSLVTSCGDNSNSIGLSTCHAAATFEYRFKYIIDSAVLTYACRNETL